MDIWVFANVTCFVGGSFLVAENTQFDRSTLRKPRNIRIKTLFSSLYLKIQRRN